MRKPKTLTDLGREVVAAIVVFTFVLVLFACLKYLWS